MTLMAGLLARAEDPTTEPATQPDTQPATQPVLLGQVIQYLPPADWTKGNGSAIADIYIDPAQKADITIEICPTGFDLTPAFRGQMLGAIRKFLEAQKVKMLLTPRLEPDDRFGVKEHDAFNLKGTNWDDLRLYRIMGPKTIAVTVRVEGGDADEVASAHKAGEALMVSAKYLKPAPK